MRVIVFQYFNLYSSLQQLFALSNKGIRCRIPCGGSCTCLSVVRSSFDRGGLHAFDISIDLSTYLNNVCAGDLLSAASIMDVVP